MEVKEQFGGDITIIGVPSLADAASYPEFIETTETGLIDHIPDEAGVIWDRFDVARQRTYVYINDDGTWEQSGYGTLAQDVAELLAS